jgi:predicted dehydrogenase
MTNPTPFRIAYVGIGPWHADRYLDSLKQLGEKIVAVWDENFAVAERNASLLNAITHRDLRDLLAQSKPDVILGMGVHAEMPGQIAAMLESPAALILEKPLGIHAADVAPLVARVEREGRFAAVAFVNRYTSLWDKMSELENAGRLGKPCYAHFRVINGSPQRYVRDNVGWMLDPAQAGGGSLMNLGTHTLDAFRRFAREEVAVVSAQLGHTAHNARIEDFSLAILRSASGVFGSVESGYCYAGMSGGDQEWRMITSNAYIIQRPDGLSIKTLDDDRLAKFPATSSDEAYHLFIADSLNRLRRGEPPKITLRDGLNVLELVDEIYRVARKNNDTQK